MKTNKKTTIQDVANYCKVAKSTVSLVINGNARVSKATRDRIFNAIELLDYKPNLNARSLKNNRNRTLGVISEDLANQYESSIIKGIADRAKFHNYELIICECEWSQEKVANYIEVLLQRKCEGIIITTPLDIGPVLEEKLQMLKNNNIPYVTILNGNVKTDYNAFVSDDEQGLSLALDHLYQLGHTRMALIAGYRDARATIVKEKIFIQYMKGLGTFDPNLIHYTDFQPEGGAMATRKCLAMPMAPTAFIAAGDMIAIGILHAVKSQGLKVPEQISIIGFGGIDLLRYTDPPLSSVNVPRRIIGEMAVENLFKQICKTEEKIATYTVVPTSLLLRGSTAMIGTI